MLKTAVALLLLTGTTIAVRIVQNNKDVLQVSKTQMSQDDAVRACKALGWSVTWSGSGACVCTKSGTGAGANCNKCDTWRLFVFQDGGTDQSPGNQSFPTKAGDYYCGHRPCRPGWNLPHGGSWQSDQPVTIEVDLKGNSLSDTDWWGAGDSDPFVRITSNMGTVKTEVIPENLNPDWKPKTISGYQLGSDIRFDVLDENSTSGNDDMGYTTLNGNELLNGLGDGRFSKTMTIISGKGKLTLTIRVTDMEEPAELTYNVNQHKYKFGEDIEITGGTVAKLVKYSVSPSLPSGLELDIGDGSISGKCDTETHMTDYTIKACNVLNGCRSSTISFECEMDPRDKDKMFNGGESWCTADTQCQKCRGACDGDADCVGDLVCFQRDASEPVPGCEGGGDGDHAEANYCIDPNDIPKPVVIDEDQFITGGPGSLPPVEIFPAPAPAAAPITIVIKLSAIGLFNGDSKLGSRSGHSDPYVQVQVLGKEEVKETRIEYNTESPEWKRPIELTDFIPGESISFKVLDKDFRGEDDDLGEAIMDGGELEKKLATHSVVRQELGLVKKGGTLKVIIEKK